MLSSPKLCSDILGTLWLLRTDLIPPAVANGHYPRTGVKKSPSPPTGVEGTTQVEGSFLRPAP